MTQKTPVRRPDIKELPESSASFGTRLKLGAEIVVAIATVVVVIFAWQSAVAAADAAEASNRLNQLTELTLRPFLVVNSVTSYEANGTFLTAQISNAGVRPVEKVTVRLSLVHMMKDGPHSGNHTDTLPNPIPSQQNFSYTGNFDGSITPASYAIISLKGLDSITLNVVEARPFYYRFDGSVWRPTFDYELAALSQFI